jgi:hypothetical protein
MHHDDQRVTEDATSIHRSVDHDQFWERDEQTRTSHRESELLIRRIRDLDAKRVGKCVKLAKKASVTAWIRQNA